LATIQANFERSHAPLKIAASQLQSFFGMLHEQGLIVSDSTGQGSELLQRRKASRSQKFFQSCSNILAIKFRGLDPELLLSKLAPKFLWVFSTWFCFLALSLFLSAGTLILVQSEVFFSKSPYAQSFFGPENLPWLVLSLAVIKIFHELAHALTCKYFGGECHEIGVMLLAFTPCLYCNVSDAWLMKNKWHRIAVSAAGIYLELIFAAVCTFLWYFSQPGLLNSLCLNFIFVCSVSTFIFNANPLLRFDGYYIFSDLVEIPNLRQQADSQLRQAMAKCFLGLDLMPGRMLTQHSQKSLILYSVLAFLYRCFVVVAILWMLNKILTPYRLEPMVYPIGLLAAIQLIFTPIWRFCAFVTDPLKTQPVHRTRLLVRGGFILAAIIGLLIFPFPYRIPATAVFSPEGATRVYVTVPGILVESIAAGNRVETGDVLGRLRNTELTREIEKLIGTQKQVENQLQILQRQRVSAPELAAQIPALKKQLEDIGQQLIHLKRDEQQLILQAQTAGIVLPAPLVNDQSNANHLGSWSGTPQDPENIGAYLEKGTLFCLVGESSRLEATLIVDQSEIQFVRIDQLVELMPAETPGRLMTGTIAEISEIDLSQTDLANLEQELMRQTNLPTIEGPDGKQRLQGTYFQVRVKISSTEHTLQMNSRGKAKIQAGTLPLYKRMTHYLSKTFSLEVR